MTPDSVFASSLTFEVYEKIVTSSKEMVEHSIFSESEFSYQRNRSDLDTTSIHFMNGH